MTSKIANIKTFTERAHREASKDGGLSHRDAMQAGYALAAKSGAAIDRADGRAYVPWRANVAGMRWQNGKLVPRKRA